MSTSAHTEAQIIGAVKQVEAGRKADWGKVKSPEQFSPSLFTAQSNRCSFYRTPPVIVRSFDRQEEVQAAERPCRGTRQRTPRNLRPLGQNTAPFFAELKGENGRNLLVGIEGTAGSVLLQPWRWKATIPCGETDSDKPEFGIGTKRNKLAVEDGCKLLKTWWPGTESNRRRQPFQGCLPIRLSGSESGQVKLGERVTRDHL
jgi:hypothetical protein